MKKILYILTILFVYPLLFSCSYGDFIFSNDYNKIDPTYWGPSYGYSQVIDGFEVCLRTDGYYQIVGIREAAIKDGVLIIPQYINGVPVMGLGANIYMFKPLIDSVLIDHRLTELYKLIYRDKSSIQLEYSWTQSTCNYNTQCKSIYIYDKNSLKEKAYVNCHHINFNLDFKPSENPIDYYLPFSKIIFNFDWDEAFGNLMDPIIYITKDNYEYYVDTDLEARAIAEELQKNSDKDIETMLFDNYGPAGPVKYRRVIYSPEFNKNRIVLCYDTYSHLKNIYNNLYTKYAEYRTLKRLWEDKNRCKNNNTEYIRIDGVDVNVNSSEYYDYLYNQVLLWLEDGELGFNVLCANIEFHYNLIIDGEQYHDFVHPKSDLYWIDHLDECETLKEPPVPFVEGYTFLGWYTDSECTNLYDFTKPINQIEDELVWLKLYAKWQ